MTECCVISTMSCFGKAAELPPHPQPTVVISTKQGWEISRNNSIERRRKKFSLCGWLRNGGFKHVFSVLWILINAAVFMSVYYHYKYEPKYYYLRKILGRTLCVSRGSSALLNLNSAALLLPVCKQLASRLRNSKLSRRAMRRWIDHYRFTHIMFAVCVCIGSVIHCAAHSFNAVRFSRGFDRAVPEVNVASFPGQNPCAMVLSTIAGTTGLGMLFVLVLMIITSLPCFRRQRHNWFWFSHHAFVLFYVLLLCHPLGGILKEQCNTDSHIPGCASPDTPQAEPMSVKVALSDAGISSKMMPHSSKQAEPNMNNSTVVCRERPVFTSHPSRTWRFLLVPASLYILERIWRWVRTYRSVAIETVRFHPGDVIDLQLFVNNFKAKPGQYVLLNCPTVSRLEWHPFTMTSCPSASDPRFSLQVKACGDWTESLQQLLKEKISHSTTEGVRLKDMPRLLVDGPLGSPSEDVLRYRVSVCIAGGIGITPFAAILNYLVSMDEEELLNLKLSRLYFIWICRDRSHFQWLQHTMSSLQQKLWRLNRPDFLILRLHVSNSESKERVDDASPITSQCYKIEHGRPNLEDVLADVTICNPRNDIGVFVCGPQKLAKRVHQMCNRLNKHKARLHFNKERFS